MDKSVKTGLSFGLTSGIITTLGLMVGLHSGTHSKLAVIGGILTIAVADAFSDALGIHISQESQGGNSVKEIWTATIAAFFAKLFFASAFLIPVLLLDLGFAILVSVCWGLFALGLFTYVLSKKHKINAFQSIAEHVGIAIVVIITTHFLGDFIANVFV